MMACCALRLPDSMRVVAVTHRKIERKLKVGQGTWSKKTLMKEWGSEAYVVGVRDHVKIGNFGARATSDSTERNHKDKDAYGLHLCATAACAFCRVLWVKRMVTPPQRYWTAGGMCVIGCRQKPKGREVLSALLTSPSVSRCPP